MRVPGEWKLDAACRDQPTEFFFEKGYHEFAKATFCDRCVVQRRCWQEAWRYQEYGTWGGVYRPFPEDDND